MPKTEQTEITAIVNGLEFKGLQVVTGQRRLYQSVTWNGSSKADPHRYAPDQRAYMKLMAEHLLIELVKDGLRHGG